MYFGLHVKYPLFLSDINEMNFYHRASKTTQMPNFMTIRHVTAQLFHVVRQIDRYDETNSRSPNFTNAPKKSVHVVLTGHSDIRQNCTTWNCGARQDALYSFLLLHVQRSLFYSVMQRAARITHRCDANWHIPFLCRRKSLGLQECTQQHDRRKPAEYLKIWTLSMLDLIKYYGSFLNKVNVVFLKRSPLTLEPPFASI
jgi:hypothetical protein